MKKQVIIYKIWKVTRGRLPRSYIVSVLLVSDANTNLKGIKFFFNDRDELVRYQPRDPKAQMGKYGDLAALRQVQPGRGHLATCTLVAVPSRTSAHARRSARLVCLKHL